MNLRTSLPILPFPFNLQHEDQVLSIGSCFAEEIAKKLNYYKFKITANPHGILYNPLSIIQCLNEIQSKKLYIEEDIFQNQEVWYSFQHHGKFSDLDPNVLIKQINKSIQRAAHALESSKLLICTLGTAFVYENKSDQRVVANCHKLPSDHFKKKLLKVETIVDAFEKTILSLSKQFPNINWLFTISPVRHLKDGFVENQRSKSTLHLAVHKLIEKFDHVHYFPSYEIVIDELRDYRFYNEDMLHPNTMAIDYIWEKFQDAIMSEATRSLNQKINKLQQGIQHRPFHVQSNQHQAFLKKLLLQIEASENDYNLNWSEEKNQIKSTLLL